MMDKLVSLKEIWKDVGWLTGKRYQRNKKKYLMIYNLVLLVKREENFARLQE